MVKSKHLKRIVEEERWRIDQIEAIKGRPWDLRGDKEEEEGEARNGTGDGEGQRQRSLDDALVFVLFALPLPLTFPVSRPVTCLPFLCFFITS